MTIPIVLFLHIGGNIILFYGFFKLLSLTVFKQNRDTKEPSKEKEIKRLERELRRL